MTLKKKIPAPLTEEQLKEKIKNVDRSKVILPSHAEGTQRKHGSEKIKKEEIKEESFNHVVISAIGYHQDQIGVDGNGNEHVFPGGIWVAFNWAIPGFGFGELTIKVNGKKITIDSERLGKDFVKAMLCNMVDQAEIK